MRTPGKALLFREYYRKQLQKFFIICTHHTYIQIVIPRNKTLVTHGSKQRTKVQPVSQPMFLTPAGKQLQQHRVTILQ